MTEKYIRDQVERVASKRTKKDLVEYAINEIVHANERARSSENLTTTLAVKLDRQLKESNRLQYVGDAIQAVIALQRVQTPNPKQLSMLLQSEELDVGEEKVLDAAAIILGEILDNCQEICEQYDDVPEIISQRDAAIEDRKRLLKLLKLTEREWSMRGGHTFLEE